MKIETEFTPDHQARLTVEVEGERLEASKRRAAAKLAKRVKIPGFRPGKAPYPVVVRTVGESTVFEEALELLIDEIYPEAIKESQINPYGPGQLEEVPSADPLTLKFLVPLDAVVTLGDYKSISKPYEPETVSEEKIQEVLESLRSRQAVLEPVERPAEEGDVVTVKLNGRIKGEEQLEINKDHSAPLLVRAAPDEDEWPFKGFSRLLIGKSVGYEGATSHAYREDYYEEGLRGRIAEFEFVIEDIKSRTLPELDDNFAASVGDFKDMAALRENIIASLERETEEAYNETYDEAVINEAIEQAEFQYAPQMLDEEIHQAIHDLEKRIERQGLNLEIYLKSRNMDDAALHEELKPLAEKRLKRALLLYEVGKEEDIQVDPEELQIQAGSTLNYLQQMLPEKEARRLNQRDVQSNLVNNVLADLLARKTIERMRQIASGRLIEAETIEADEPPALAADAVDPNTEPDKPTTGDPQPDAGEKPEAEPIEKLDN